MKQSLLAEPILLTAKLLMGALMEGPDGIFIFHKKKKSYQASIFNQYQYNIKKTWKITKNCLAVVRFEPLLLIHNVFVFSLFALIGSR